MASKPPSGASKLPEISAFSTSALNFSVFVVSVIWCLKPYGSAHGSGQGDFCLSVLGSMNGISFLSTNEPNPSRRSWHDGSMRSIWFFTAPDDNIVRIAVADRDKLRERVPVEAERNPELAVVRLTTPHEASEWMTRLVREPPR